jgi:hypothetical protein
MDAWEKQHAQNIDYYSKQIDEIFRNASKEAALIGVSITNFNPNKPFSFKDYPQTKKRIDNLLQTVYKKSEAVIVNGIKKEWDQSNVKNDAFVENVIKEKYKGVDKSQFTTWFDHNDKALEMYLSKISDKRTISERVWNLTSQFRTELEMALDIGFRDGKSADEISRDIRKYLQNPDALFRRVRDEHGVLHLSKRAAAYHPGQGVYRSSYKNARRLAATETNMAYRYADNVRYNQLDFIVGYEVHLSGGHKINDICDDFAGLYPKSFVFRGWHPQCMCFTTTIMQTDKEFMEDTKRMIRDEEPIEKSANSVKNVPDGFNNWIDENKNRVAAAKSTPFFIQDNFKDGDIKKGLNI